MFETAMLAWSPLPADGISIGIFELSGIQYLPMGMGHNHAELPQKRRLRSRHCKVPLKSKTLQNAFYAGIRPSSISAHEVSP